MTLSTADINLLQKYPDKLKRLLKRSLKIDLDNKKSGFRGEPLKLIDESTLELIEFSRVVFTSQQVKIDELKQASSQFLTSFTELQQAISD
ncbi:MAG: hypothetical protein HRT95_05540 [Moritella sp.]|uniref:hypothetical protein n=1 Tax=Moritella sp. TaxID=78556 RepID=UPI001DA3952A|nr:hypothetical protein [Moritella sp.]NQZ49653.1 hypothetical protein [Moritella sp.]